MPAAMVDRPKMGFGVPIGDWFRGPLGDRYRGARAGAHSALRDHLDTGVATRLLEEHVAGRDGHDARLCSLLDVRAVGPTLAA